MKGGTRKRGNKWYYYFDAGIVDGKRKKIERVGGTTKKEALESLRHALNEFDRCGSVVDETEMSFADFLDYWFKEYVELNCRYNTIRHYRKVIDIHIKPVLGIYKLKSLSPRVIQEFINTKASEGYSKSSLSGFSGVLSTSLKWAVYPQNLIKENPVQYISIPKIQVKKKDDNLKIISKDEFSKILERFPFGSSGYTSLQIAFHTGMRGGEVSALTWDNVDLENNLIYVEKTFIYKSKGEWELGDPKTDRSRRKILIGQTLVNILKRQKKWQIENKLRCGPYYKKSEYDFVCTKSDGSHAATQVIRYMSRIVNDDLGIVFTFHSLRHTHATMLLEAGANTKDIQERLGHSKLSTTMDTYSHVTDKMKQDSVDIFESIIN